MQSVTAFRICTFAIRVRLHFLPGDSGKMDYRRSLRGRDLAIRPFIEYCSDDGLDRCLSKHTQLRLAWNTVKSRFRRLLEEGRMLGLA